MLKFKNSFLSGQNIFFSNQNFYLFFVLIFSRFSKLLGTYLKLLTPELDYEFVISADGSGKGAALVAALKR